MCNKIWATAKINLKNLKVAYIITAITLVGMSSNYIIDVFLARSMDLSGNVGISGAWTFWMLPVLAAVLVPSRNFKRTMNLGGKRDSFFWGSLMVYAVLAGAVSLVALIVNYAVDAPFVNSGTYGGMFTAPGVFGWDAHGGAVAFFRQFAFLFLFSAVVHTLTAMQDKWYVWVADVLIIAVISVFTPIAPLRAALVRFFNLILFHPNSFVHIAACLIIALGVYSFNRLILARKAI